MQPDTLATTSEADALAAETVAAETVAAETVEMVLDAAISALDMTERELVAGEVAGAAVAQALGEYRAAEVSALVDSIVTETVQGVLTSALDSFEADLSLQVPPPSAPDVPPPSIPAPQRRSCVPSCVPSWVPILGAM
eukprot:3958977-Prymnesium_polylepis.1